jgi:hypothetical protein
VGDPPPNVPILSDDERSPAGLTIPEQLALHREAPVCASCHQHIDPLGLPLQRYDGIGAYRPRDEAGQPVLHVGVNPDGREIEGFAGLKAYLADKQDLVVANLCRKFLGYALGRSVGPGDKPLLAKMQRALEQNDYRSWALLETILTSEAFRHRPT